MRVLNGFPTYYAWGYGGQFIYVIPDLDAVIVVTSSPNPGDGRREHRRQLNDVIEAQLVPVIRDAVIEK
jgi:CubicO group peptidase (beta-lactamase class C family)